MRNLVFFRKSDKNEECIFEDRVKVINVSIFVSLYFDAVSFVYLFFLFSECRGMSPLPKGALEGDEPVARSRSLWYVLFLFPITLLVS